MRWVRKPRRTRKQESDWLKQVNRLKWRNSILVTLSGCHEPFDQKIGHNLRPRMDSYTATDVLSLSFCCQSSESELLLLNIIHSVVRYCKEVFVARPANIGPR